MSYRSILVPTDGSEFTEAALDAAIELAKLSDGSITAMYVVDPTSITAVRRDAGETITSSLNKEGQDALAYIRMRCRDEGVPVETRMAGGYPADAIVEASSEFDTIVMSTLGKTGITKLLIGSVAEKVVRSAKCRVMTIRVQRDQTFRCCTGPVRLRL